MKVAWSSREYIHVWISTDRLDGTIDALVDPREERGARSEHQYVFAVQDK